MNPIRLVFLSIFLLGFDVAFYSSMVNGLVLCLGRRLAIASAAIDRKAGYAHHGGLLSGVVGGGVGVGL
jgi:hypothetical protein